MTRNAIALLTVAALLSACGRGSDKPSAETTTSATVSSDAAAPTVAPAASAASAPAAADTGKLLASLPAPYSSGDPAHGHVVFARCQVCHLVAKGAADSIGPNLWGVFGRKAGSRPGYAYSEGLKAAGFTWDAQRIDTWIANPRAVVPGTKMSFAGLSDAKDRIDVVAYLKTAGSN